MKDNRFTFIMPAFNAEETIGYAISTIMLQNYHDWKLIVIDDMSTDSTVDTVQSMIEGYGFSEDKLN